MPIADTGLARARRVFSKHGGMLRTSKAIRLGIHPRTLYALRDAGDIERVGEICGAPVDLIGVGPHRDQLVTRRPIPFRRAAAAG